MKAVEQFKIPEGTEVTIRFLDEATALPKRIVEQIQEPVIRNIEDQTVLVGKDLLTGRTAYLTLSEDLKQNLKKL